MRISAKTDYALRTVLDLALHGSTGLVRIGDVARRQGIPPKYLEQILLVLKHAGLVQSRRGAKGGYRLAVPASAITMATIVGLTDASLLAPPPLRTSSGPFVEVWQEVTGAVRDRLESVSIRDMCRRARELAASPPLEYVI